MQNLLKTPNIYVNSISNCLTCINQRTCSLVALQRYEAAVFLSHLHALISLIVTSCVVSMLIQQTIDLHLFIVYMLVVLLHLQETSVKVTMVVTCLKVSSPVFLYTPFSPRTAASQLSFWMAKMSLDDKPMPVAQSGFKQLISGSWATARFGAVCQPVTELTPSANLSDSALPVNTTKPTCFVVKKELAECV